MENERVEAFHGMIDLESVDENELSVVKRAMESDKDAFEQLFMSNYKYVFTVVYGRLRNDEDAYDAIQETFIRVYKSIGELNSPEAFRPWLRRIAENSAKMILRKQKKDGTVDSLDDMDELVDTSRSRENEVVIDVSEVLKELPEEQTQLLIRVYYDRITVADLAKLQGIPYTTLRHRLRAAENALREKLQLKGIDRAIYGGDLFSMLANALRHIIGTRLLSMAVAQEILQNVTGSSDKKGAFVVGKLAGRQVRKAAFGVAGFILVACLLIGVACFTVINLIYRSTLPTDSASVSSGAESTQTSSEDAFSSSSVKDTASSETSVPSSKKEPTSSKGDSAVQSTPSQGGSAQTGGGSSPQSGSEGSTPNEDTDPSDETPVDPLRLEAERLSKMEYFSPYKVGMPQISYDRGNNSYRYIKGVYRCAVVDDWIITSFDGHLYAVNMDGSEVYRIWEGFNNAFYIYDGRIYWFTSGAVHSAELDGSDQKTLAIASGLDTESVVMNDQYIYVRFETTSDIDRIYRIHRDLSRAETVSGYRDVAIVNGKEYFLTADGVYRGGRVFSILGAKELYSFGDLLITTDTKRNRVNEDGVVTIYDLSLGKTVAIFNGVEAIYNIGDYDGGFISISYKTGSNTGGFRDYSLTDFKEREYTYDLFPTCYGRYAVSACQDNVKISDIVEGTSTKLFEKNYYYGHHPDLIYYDLYMKQNKK